LSGFIEGKFDLININSIEYKHMKAVEVTGTLDEKGQLTLDHPIENFQSSRVRIIVLIPEVTESAETDPVRVDRGISTPTSPSERNVQLSLHSAP
jgi:hypothetical protein